MSARARRARTCLDRMRRCGSTALAPLLVYRRQSCSDCRRERSQVENQGQTEGGVIEDDDDLRLRWFPTLGASSATTGKRAEKTGSHCTKLWVRGLWVRGPL